MMYEDFSLLLEHLKRVAPEKHIYIWGTGIYGELIGRLFNQEKIPWKGYYDNNPDDQQTDLNGHRIKDGRRVAPDGNDIFVISIKYFEDVKQQLLHASVKERDIIWFENNDTFTQIQHLAVDSAPYRMKLKKFKDLHTGERCLLVGNGPSLLIEDLERAKRLNLVSFASNRIYKCYDSTDWRATYHFFVDANGIRKIFTGRDVLEYISVNCNAIFTRSDGLLFDYRDDNYVKNLYYFDSLFSESEDSFDFAEDCSDHIFTGFSVTYAMLQFAVYMGFKEIYMIGMDHNYSVSTIDGSGAVTVNKNVNDHSEILGNEAVWGVADIYKITKAYESARDYAKVHGIKIYNASRGGKLEVFERIDFDSLD